MQVLEVQRVHQLIVLVASQRVLVPLKPLLIAIHASPHRRARTPIGISSGHLCEHKDVATRDGDGWVLCTKCQSRHCGLHGAAGLLLVRTDIEPASVLLQLRAAWTQSRAIQMSIIDEQNAGMILHDTTIRGTVKMPTQGMTYRRNAYSVN